MPELKITFPTEEMKNFFASWMSGSGEQEFMEIAEENLGVRHLHFGYHGVENEEFPRDDKRRYGPFLCDNTIRVTIVED